MRYEARQTQYVTLKTGARLPALASLLLYTRYAVHHFQDMSVPDTKVLTIGSWRIGMVNGYQLLPWGDTEAMAALARQVRDGHALPCLLLSLARALTRPAHISTT